MADDPGATEEPVPTPFFHSMLLDRAVGALLAEAMRESPLSPLDYGIASAVADQPGISTTELATQFSSSLTTVAEWVTRLVTTGVLARERDPQDGRRQRLSITPEGQQLTAAARECFGRAYVAYLHRLPEPPELGSDKLILMTTAARAALEDLRQGQG